MAVWFVCSCCVSGCGVACRLCVACACLAQCALVSLCSVVWLCCVCLLFACRLLCVVLHAGLRCE